jgi:uncharacterized protein (DUF111 family)
MSTELVHHPIRIRVGIASSEADEMNRLATEGVHDLASHVVSAFHEIGDNDTVADSFSSIGTKKTLDFERTKR